MDKAYISAHVAIFRIPASGNALVISDARVDSVDASECIDVCDKVDERTV